MLLLQDRLVVHRECVLLAGELLLQQHLVVLLLLLVPVVGHLGCLDVRLLVVLLHHQGKLEQQFFFVHQLRDEG